MYVVRRQTRLQEDIAAGRYIEMEGNGALEQELVPCLF